MKFLALALLLVTTSVAFADLETSNKTCAQVQAYVKAHSQTRLNTTTSNGYEFSTYSFDYADCGGTVPGFVCTLDNTYCHVGWWCEDQYPSAVNPAGHMQGTDFCPASRR